MIVEGRFSLLLPDHEQIWAMTRTLQSQVLVMSANCSSEPATLPPGSVPNLDNAQALLTTHGAATSSALRPWESRIHLLGKLSYRWPWRSGTGRGGPSGNVATMDCCSRLNAVGDFLAMQLRPWLYPAVDRRVTGAVWPRSARASCREKVPK